MFRITLALFISAFSVLAHAEVPGPKPRPSPTPLPALIDFRVDLGPPRDQRNKGWCYANVAADLLGHKLKGEGQKPISAAYAALGYAYEYRSDPTDDGGFVSLAILKASETGFCPQILEDEVLGRGTNQGDLDAKLDAFKTFKESWDTWRLSSDGDKAALAKNAFENQYSQYIRSQSVVADIGRERMEYLLDNSTKKNFFVKFSGYLCGDQRTHPKQGLSVRTGLSLTPQVHPYKIKGKQILGDTSLHVRGRGMYFPKLNRGYFVPFVRGWADRSGLEANFKVFDRQLVRGNPVSILYYAGFLSEKFMSSSVPSKQGERHASILVGRRLLPGMTEPEYLIRNSWGPKWRCAESEAQCAGDGHVWVPKSVLQSRIYGFAYIN